MRFPPYSAAAISALLSAIKSSAAPTSSSTNHWSAATVIYPYATSLYYVFTGDIYYDSSYGLIRKGSGGVSDVTTLVTFAIPDTWAGRTCRLVFNLDSDDALTGSKSAAVFTSLAPVERSSSNWSPGNQRDQYYGRFTLNGSNSGKWTETEDQESPQFDCPAAQVIAWELVGVSDQDEIRWVATSGDGPRIEVV